MEKTVAPLKTLHAYLCSCVSYLKEFHWRKAYLNKWAQGQQNCELFLLANLQGHFIPNGTQNVKQVISTDSPVSAVKFWGVVSWPESSEKPLPSMLRRSGKRAANKLQAWYPSKHHYIQNTHTCDHYKVYNAFLSMVLHSFCWLVL